MLRLLIVTLFCVSANADTLSITDGVERERHPGKFIWTDLVSSNPQDAADFYSQLFGWQINPFDDDYLVIRNHGRPIGGIALNEADGEEVRTQWISYLSSRDIDAAHERLMSAGAEAILDPMTVSGRGKFGIYAGPDGGLFGVLTAQDGDPEERGADLGDWIWIELWSKRPQVAAEFYEGLGFSVARNWASANENDRLLVAGDYARGGIVEGHPEQKHSAWLLYVRVADVDETLARAGRLGGEVVVLDGEVNSNGEIALVQDPTGGIVAIYQYPELGEVVE
ncbi:MAG: VOC family protein [Pseudomonadales bacterium]|nr:VOC family protein [Pseudomonadales bacterium]